MIYAHWHGGSSYSWPDGTSAKEQFPSIEAAADALRDRLNLGHIYPQPFAYPDHTDRALTPCVGLDSAMFLYAAPDAEDAFLLLEFGPRGGVKRTRL